jgi:hypothetical protein
MRSRSIGRPTDCGGTVQKQEVPVWMARLNTEYESCRFWEKRLSANQPLAYIKAPDAYEGKWASSPFGGHDNSCMSDEPQYINRPAPDEDYSRKRLKIVQNKRWFVRAANDRPTYRFSPMLSPRVSQYKTYKTILAKSSEKICCSAPCFRPRYHSTRPTRPS